MEFDFYEHIEAYINGSLSNDLKDQMDSAIRTDSSLQLAIDNYPDAKLISEGLLEVDVLETLEKLESEEQQKENKMTDKKASKSKVVPILLAVLAIAAIAFWLSQTKSEVPAKEQGQLATNYERPINDNATKSAATLDDQLEEGKRLFDLNKFGQAAAVLEQAALVNLDPSKRADIHFWLAHCHFQMENYSKARLNAAISGHKDTDKLMKQIKAALQNPDRNK